MTVYDLIKGSEIEKIDLPLSVVLGNFDGLHRGHLALIEKAKCSFRKCCVFTFSQNPFSAPRIMDIQEKKRVLRELGADYLAVFDFDEIRDMSWQDFVDDLLISGLNCKNAVCGYNFRFGKGALGTSELLKEYLEKRGIEVHICDAVLSDGEAISSSRIRALLSEGKIEDANRLLGRPYTLTFHVSHGNGIGRSLGFPTINQSYDPRDIKLPYGVYICRCGSRTAITNFGVRPTVVSEGQPVYEAYILNYTADLYGADIPVEFHKMIRPEMRFPDFEALSRQIACDVRQAEEFFK